MTISTMFQLHVMKTVLHMVAVCQDTVIVTLVGREKHVMGSHVIPVVISMVSV